jgi:hypothetical protein
MLSTVLHVEDQRLAWSHCEGLCLENCSFVGFVGVSASQTITMSFGKLLVPEELVTCDGFSGWQC